MVVGQTAATGCQLCCLSVGCFGKQTGGRPKRRLFPSAVSIRVRHQSSRSPAAVGLSVGLLLLLAWPGLASLARRSTGQSGWARQTTLNKGARPSARLSLGSLCLSWPGRNCLPRPGCLRQPKVEQVAATFYLVCEARRPPNEQPRP